METLQGILQYTGWYSPWILSTRNNGEVVYFWDHIKTFFKSLEGQGVGQETTHTTYDLFKTGGSDPILECGENNSAYLRSDNERVCFAHFCLEEVFIHLHGREVEIEIEMGNYLKMRAVDDVPRVPVEENGFGIISKEVYNKICRNGSPENLCPYLFFGRKQLLCAKFTQMATGLFHAGQSAHIGNCAPLRN